MSYLNRFRMMFGTRTTRLHVPREERISAFIDGELDDDEREQMAARFALDPQIRQNIHDLRAVDDLVHQALLPPSVPSADLCAQTAWCHPGDQLLALMPAPPSTQSRVPAAVLASVGLLVTAGIAFVGLRRRGLV